MNEIKTCGRCSATFNCNHNSIENCDCLSVVLDSKIQDFLKKTSYNCLCNDCLTELNDFIALEKTHPFPSSPGEYVAGVHYYIENGFWVFTEYFHYLKGRCCQNSCRHCAYGFTGK